MAEPIDYTKLRPLPKLKVVRDTYCSQEMTDRIVDYLAEHHEKRMLLALEDELPVRNYIHFEAYHNLMAIVREDAAKAIPVPDTPLGYVDLAYEISRRIRVGYDMPDVPVHGKPLAPSREGPYPELVKLEISPSAKKCGLDQSTVDKILDEVYVANYQTCYDIGEMIRREQGLSWVWGLVPSHVSCIVCNDPTHPQGPEPEKRIRSELGQRIGLMCNVPGFGTGNY